MPVVVKYGGDGLRYPLHRAACQGDDAGLERLLHALRSGTPVPTEELKGGNTGGKGAAELLALESAPEPEADAGQDEDEVGTKQLAVIKQEDVVLTEEHLQGTDVEGCTPLHYSCYMGAARCCALLLQAKAEINKKDAIDAGTALHFAAWKGDWPDIVQMLLDAGANRKLRNNYHKTPLEYAKDNRRIQTVAILKGGKGKKGKQKGKQLAVRGGGTAIDRVLAQGGRGKQDRRLKADCEDGKKSVTLHIGGGNSEGEKPPDNDADVPPLDPKRVERQGGVKVLTPEERAEFQEEPKPGQTTVTLTQKQLKDICTRTRLAGTKPDISRVMMEGSITTEPEQSEEAPEPPVVVDCEEMLADKQIVTQLVGGGSLPTSKAKAKVNVEAKLSGTENNHISTHDSSTTTPVGATAIATSTTSSVQDAKREKARRKKKLKKERDRAAKAAAAAAAAAEAAATATAATGASTTILGAFDGVD